MQDTTGLVSGGKVLCRIVHLFNWHNSSTRTFSTILILQNTPYSAKIFHRWNSAEYTFSKFRIPQSAFRKLHLP